jgi:hypothetical protein
MDTAVGILSWPLGLFTNGNQDCLMVELVLLTNLCLLDHSLIYLFTGPSIYATNPVSRKKPFLFISKEL